MATRWDAENKQRLAQYRFETNMTLSRLVRQTVGEWERSWRPRVRKRQRKGPGRETVHLDMQIDDARGHHGMSHK
jgi:transposase-like protein